MKCIMLAAGKSTRTWPLTITRPKPLLKILDKTIIEHNLLQLKGIVDEVIIVVGFMKEKIIDLIGEKFHEMKITYVEQKEQLGTGHAVLICKDKIKEENFIVIGSDDLFSSIDLKNFANQTNTALAKEVENPEDFGIFKANSKNEMQDLIEKPSQDIGNLANTGAYILSRKIFNYLEKTKKSARKEIELTSAILDFTKKEKISFKILQVQDYWLPIGYPWNYLEANVFMLNRINKWENRGKIENHVLIEGNVFIEDGAVIKSGTHIEGPAYIGMNCIIGPHAYIRPNTVIMDNVRTRAEIYDSVLMDNTTAKHHCYIGHSVLGENVNIGAGTITSDYRHDGEHHITLIKGKKIHSRRKKLGAFIGDNAKTGIGTLIYPGRKLWPNTTTLPGEIIKKDKEK